jgi:hypothetical protein
MISHGHHTPKDRLAKCYLSYSKVVFGQLLHLRNVNSTFTDNCSDSLKRSDIALIMGAQSRYYSIRDAVPVIRRQVDYRLMTEQCFHGVSSH